jgi:hypothetical protein
LCLHCSSTTFAPANDDDVRRRGRSDREIRRGESRLIASGGESIARAPHGKRKRGLVGRKRKLERERGRGSVARAHVIRKGCELSDSLIR